MSKGRSFTVQIQDPRVGARHFDLVAVPEHDPMRAPNVIVTTAAPNRITAEKLDVAKKEFAGLFEPLPNPRIAVLLGGNSKAHMMTAQKMNAVGKQLAQLEGGLMITASRRTGDTEKQAFLDALGNRPHWFWDGQGQNPYLGMLAWADYILVTADSVSMLSDAGTTGKPVYMIPLEGGTARFDRFHQNLLKHNIARVFDGTLEHWSYAPLRDAQKIAAEIKRLMALR